MGRGLGLGGDDRAGGNGGGGQGQNDLLEHVFTPLVSIEGAASGVEDRDRPRLSQACPKGGAVLSEIVSNRDLS
jgi:hypothetical protein